MQVPVSLALLAEQRSGTAHSGPCVSELETDLTSVRSGLAAPRNTWHRLRARAVQPAAGESSLDRQRPEATSHTASLVSSDAEQQAFVGCVLNNLGYFFLWYNSGAARLARDKYFLSKYAHFCHWSCSRRDLETTTLVASGECRPSQGAFQLCQNKKKRA